MSESYIESIVAAPLRAAASGGSVVTIGNFDGVHQGHRSIVEAVVAEARDRGLLSVAVTFEPHPVTVFRGRAAAEFRLSTAEQRERLLRTLGVDRVLTIAFDRRFAALSAESFVELLVGPLAARSVHVGYDFNFGRGRTGNTETLRTLCAAHGADSSVHGAITIDGAPVSSTRVRDAVARGDMDLAERLLGHPHAIAGSVASGAGRGKGMGIPTLNLYPTEVLLPPHGVYATTLIDAAGAHEAITNIGVRPTFEDDDRVSVETMVLGPYEASDGEATIDVQLHAFIRPEQRFESKEALVAQIGADVETARRIHASRRSR